MGCLLSNVLLHDDDEMDIRTPGVVHECIIVVYLIGKRARRMDKLLIVSQH